MADDEEKLPKDEDETEKGADEAPQEADADVSNPFSQFINHDLSLSGVPEQDEASKTPADDKDLIPPKAESADLFGDDDEDEDKRPPSRFGLPPSPFGPPRFGTLPPRFGSSPDREGKDEPPRPTPFGSSRFGTGSSPFGGSSTPPPSGGLFGRSNQPPSGGSPPPPSFGSRFGASSTPPSSSSSFGSSFGSRPQPTPKSFSERMGELIMEWLEKEARTVIVWLVVAIITLMTLLYIDNLRLTLATQRGQVIELQAQVERLEELLGVQNPPASAEE